MNTSAPQSQSQLEDIREKILDAAERRFRSYGYGKTTMSEIAGDAGMSAANLYRYFENKQEIGAACADRCICTRLGQIKAAVRVPGQSAGQRLLSYVLTAFHSNLEMIEEQTKISELVEFVTSEHKELVQQKIEGRVSLLAEILAYGNETGEFEVDDVVLTARAVYASFSLFDVPMFAHLFPKAEFEALAEQVVTLILRGLNKRT